MVCPQSTNTISSTPGSAAQLDAPISTAANRFLHASSSDTAGARVW